MKHSGEGGTGQCSRWQVCERAERHTQAKVQPGNRSLAGGRSSAPSQNAPQQPASVHHPGRRKQHAQPKQGVADAQGIAGHRLARAPHPPQPPAAAAQRQRGAGGGDGSEQATRVQLAGASQRHHQQPAGQRVCGREAAQGVPMLRQPQPQLQGHALRHGASAGRPVGGTRPGHPPEHMARNPAVRCRDSLCASLAACRAAAAAATSSCRLRRALAPDPILRGSSSGRMTAVTKGGAGPAPWVAPPAPVPWLPAASCAPQRTAPSPLRAAASAWSARCAAHSA